MKTKSCAFSSSSTTYVRIGRVISTLIICSSTRASKITSLPQLGLWHIPDLGLPACRSRHVNKTNLQTGTHNDVESFVGGNRSCGCNKESKIRYRVAPSLAASCKEASALEIDL